MSMQIDFSWKHTFIPKNLTYLNIHQQYYFVRLYFTQKNYIINNKYFSWKFKNYLTGT